MNRYKITIVYGESQHIGYVSADSIYTAETIARVMAEITKGRFLCVAFCYGSGAH